MTITKKEKNVKDDINASYDKFLFNIKEYYKKQEVEFVKDQEYKMEIFRNKLYSKSLKHNKKIKNLERHAKNLKKKLAFKHNKIVKNFEDLKLSQAKYDLYIKKFNSKLIFEKVHKEKFEKKNKTYKKRFENVKKIFIKKNKIKIKKFEILKTKFMTTNKKNETKAISNLKNKKKQILKSNKLYIIKMKQQQSVLQKEYDSKINILKHQKNNKEIGVHTFDDRKHNLNKKLSSRISKINNNIASYTPIVLTTEILKSKSKNIVQENINRYFLPGMLREMKKIISNNKIIFIILILLFYTSMKNSYFWNIDTLLITMKGSSEVIILALAMTLVIITGGIDLSVGSVMAFSGVLMCSLAQNGTNIYIAVFVGILVSTLIGLMNGILIGYAKIVPFIVTLAGLLAFRGLAILYADSKPISLEGNAAKVFGDFSNATFLGINAQIWVVIGCILLFVFVLKFTIFGRQVFSIGSNRQAAYLSGVQDKKVEMFVYTISGFMAGLAALLISSRVQGIQPTAGNAWELKAIAAVVLGGTALSGGKGGIIGTVIGWIILAFMPTVFITLGYSSQIEKVATGLIIIVAIFFNNNLDFKGGFINAKEKSIKLFKQYFLRERR